MTRLHFIDKTSNQQVGQWPDSDIPSPGHRIILYGKPYKVVAVREKSESFSNILVEEVKSQDSKLS